MSTVLAVTFIIRPARSFDDEENHARSASISFGASRGRFGSSSPTIAPLSTGGV